MPKTANLLDANIDKTDQSINKQEKLKNKDATSNKNKKPKKQPKTKNTLNIDITTDNIKKASEKAEKDKLLNTKKEKKEKKDNNDLDDFNKLKMFKTDLKLKEDGKKDFIPPTNWKNTYTFNELNDKQHEIIYKNKKTKDLNCFIIPTGKDNNILVVDFDEKEQYEYLKKQYNLKDTLTIQTKRGFHLYYQYDEDIPQNAQHILEWIDIRSEGGFIIAPPTKYKNFNGTEEFEYKIKYAKKINKIPTDFKELLLKNIKDKPKDKSKNTRSNPKDKNDKNANTEIKRKDEMIKCISEMIDKEEDEEVKFYMTLYNTLTRDIIDFFDDWFKMVMSAINLNIDKKFIQLISWKFDYFNNLEALEKIDNLFNKEYTDDEKKCDDNILKYWCNKYNKQEYFNVCLKFQKFLDLDFDIINDRTLANIYIKIFGENVIISSKTEGTEDKVYIYNEKKIRNKNRRSEIRMEWFEDKDDGNDNKHPLLKNSISKNLGDFFNAKRKAEMQKLNELYERQEKLNNKNEDDKTDGEKHEELSLNFKIKNQKALIKITKCCECDVGNQSTKSRLTKEVFEFFYCRKVMFNTYYKFDVNDEEDYNIHYQDGYFDLKEKKFKQREKENLISKVIDFNGNYNKDDLLDEMNKWTDIITKTIPNSEDRLFYRKWLLYNLTGKTHYQQQFFNSGDGANGKTNLFEMLKIAFPIYVENLDKEVFASGNNTRHKSIFKLSTNPIRCCYLEEIEGQKVDKGFFKEITGSQNGTIKCKQLYKQTEAEIRIKNKFNFNFNELPDLDNDEATYRRLNEMPFTSKFCDNEDKLNEEKQKRINLNEEDKNCPYKEENVYYKDYTLIKKINTEKMKVALLYYILYGEDTEISVDDKIDFTKYKAIYKDNTDDIDEFKLLFEEKYEFTNNSNDRLHKKNLEDYFKCFKKNRTYNSDLIILKMMKQKYNKKFEYVKNIPLRKKDVEYEFYKGQGIYKFIKVKDEFEENFGRNKYNFVDEDDL